MKYLLDSHVLDWAQRDTTRLSRAALTAIENARPGDLAVSDVTLSELARHLAMGTIPTSLAPGLWLRAALAGPIATRATATSSPPPPSTGSHSSPSTGRSTRSSECAA